MPKLKLGAILDDKPVKITVDLPADIHRDLAAYATALAKETGEKTIDPVRLVPVMLAKFMASDRAFTKSARATAG
jgi:hypothetical protein